MTTVDPLSLTEAKRLVANADTILLRATRDADLETPIGAFLRLDDGGPAYLLESVEGGERLGRYSFLGVGPRRLLEVRDGVASVQSRPLSVDAYSPDLPIERSPAPDPLAALRAFVARRRVQPVDGMPRFTGGAVGALAYDAVSTFEPTVPLPDADPVGVPTAGFIETDLVLVFDHLTHTISAIASLHTDAPDFEGRYAIAERAIFEALERTARPSATELAGQVGGRSSTSGGTGRASRPAPVRSPTPGSTRASAATPTSGRSRWPRTRSPRARRSRSSWPVASRSTCRQDRRAADRRHRPVPVAPAGQPQPVPVLRPDAVVRGRRGEPRAPPPGRGRPADDPPDRRDAAARRDAAGGPGPRRAAPARPEGEGRARDARRSRTERSRPGQPARDGPGHQVHGGRAVQPRPPPRQPRRGTAPTGPGRARRPPSGLPGRDAVRRPEGPRDAADRGGGARAPRPVRRRGRLPRLRRQPRHGDHDPERGPAGRSGPRPHRRRHRGRARSPRRSSRRPSTRPPPCDGRSSWPPGPARPPGGRRPGASEPGSATAAVAGATGAPASGGSGPDDPRHRQLRLVHVQPRPGARGGRRRRPRRPQRRDRPGRGRGAGRRSDDAAPRDRRLARSGRSDPRPACRSRRSRSPPIGRSRSSASASGCSRWRSAFGGSIVRAPTLVHGEASEVTHDGEGLLRGLSPAFMAARYHSLCVDRDTLPDELRVTRDDRGGRGDHGPPPRDAAARGRPVPPRSRS